MPDLTDCLETLRRTGQARLDDEESVINPETTTPEQQDFLNRIKRVRLQ